MTAPVATAPAAVSCRDLYVELGGAAVLRGIDLDVPTGQWTSIIGPNGAGKTTLLRALGGLVDHSGAVEYSGTDLASTAAKVRAQLVASVPQQPEVPPGMAVFDYVMLGRASHQRFGLGSTSEDRTTVSEVLNRLDLGRFAARGLRTLSGGELQRAVIARALAQDAPIMLLDEPTSALDIGHQIEVLELIEELRNERNLTVISTLHDLSLAGQFADRIVLLSKGLLVADGDPVEVLTEHNLKHYYGATVEVIPDEHGVAIVVRRPANP